MAKRTVRAPLAKAPPAKPKAKEVTRSDRVRAEWINFEVWLRAQRETSEGRRTEAIDALKEEVDKKLKTLPRHFHAFITQQYEAQLADALAEENQLVLQAREEWEERLQRAGLEAEDWTDITATEMEAVSLALGGHLEDDVDDLPAVLPETVPFGLSAHANRPAVAQVTPVGGQRAYVPASFATVDPVGLRPDLSARSLPSDAVPFPISDNEEDENSHPRSHLPRSGDGAYKRWAAEMLPKPTENTRPRGSSITERVTSSAQPAQPVLPQERSPGSRGSQTQSLRSHYVGPVLFEPKPTTEVESKLTMEEAEFQTFKWEVRKRKIHEFHELAESAEIHIAWQLNDPQLDDNDVDGLLAEHLHHMQELRRTKEMERKALVDAERAKIRADMRRKSAVEQERVPSARRPSLFDSQRSDTETESRMPAGSGLRKQAQAATVKKNAPTAAKWGPEPSFTTTPSPPKGEPMQIDREHLIWRPGSVAPVVQDAKTSKMSSTSRARKSSLLSPEPRDEPKDDELTEREGNANTIKRPVNLPKAKNQSSVEADNPRKKGRSVTVEEVFEDEDAIVPPPKRTGTRQQPKNDDPPVITIADLGVNSRTKKSSPISGYATDRERASHAAPGAGSATTPKSAMKTAGKLPMEQSSSSLFAEKPADDPKSSWDMVFDQEGQDELTGNFSGDPGAAKHVRWTPSVMFDSDTESIMDSAAALLGELSAHGVGQPEIDDAEINTPRSLRPGSHTDSGSLEEMARTLEASVVENARSDNADNGKRKRETPASKGGKRKGKGKTVRQDTDTETPPNDMDFYKQQLMEALR